MTTKNDLEKLKEPWTEQMEELVRRVDLLQYEANSIEYMKKVRLVIQDAIKLGQNSTEKEAGEYGKAISIPTSCSHTHNLGPSEIEQLKAKWKAICPLGYEQVVIPIIDEAEQIGFKRGQDTHFEKIETKYGTIKIPIGSTTEQQIRADVLKQISCDNCKLKNCPFQDEYSICPALKFKEELKARLEK